MFGEINEVVDSCTGRGLRRRLALLYFLWRESNRVWRGGGRVSPAVRPAGYRYRRPLC